MAAVADRFVRELVLSNLTSHEHSAALAALFREAASEVAASAAAEAAEWRRLARNPIKVRPPRTLPRPLFPIFFAALIINSKQRTPRSMQRSLL